MDQSIPIRNIYYLLCYAWNMLEEGETVDVDSLESPELVDLFARILSNGFHHLMRRGLDRGYVQFSEETVRIRGKIEFSETITRNLWWKRRPVCSFDELRHDVLHNQILRSTIEHLLKVPNLDSKLRPELREVRDRLRDITPIRLSPNVFRRVVLHRNNHYYRFLLNVCEIAFHNLLVNEQDGSYRMRDFIRNEVQFRALFEAYVRNFYRLRQHKFSVGRTNLYWDIKDASEDTLKRIPEMQTDVCLTSVKRQIIIDCKFTKRIFQNAFGKATIRSEHLYQMYAYLENGRRQKGWHDLAGILLYPALDDQVDLQFTLGRFPFRVYSINLNQDWCQIEIDLLRLVDDWESTACPPGPC